MDCVFLVNWDAWLPRIRDAFPVGVQKPGDDDGDIDKPELDSEDEVEQVQGGADRPKTTPSKKRQASQDDGDSEEETPPPPKKATGKAKDSAPLNTFHGQEPNSQEKVVCFAL